MESLALLVTILVSPAFFGGPIAFLLTFWRREQISTFRRTAIYLLSTLSLLSGGMLIFQNVSRGALLIGINGLVFGFLAILRIRNH
jgi:hypothetical protein